MEDAEGERQNGIGGGDAGVVFGVDCYSRGGVGDVADDGVEEEPRIGGGEVSGCEAFDEGVETAGVVDVVVGFRILVEGCVLW